MKEGTDERKVGVYDVKFQSYDVDDNLCSFKMTPPNFRYHFPVCCKVMKVSGRHIHPE